MKFDSKMRVEDKDLVGMMSGIADQMFMSGKTKMESTKLGITCYASLTGINFRMKYSINWQEVYACVEPFIMARIRHFYLWNMGIEVVLNTDAEEPMKLHCDGREIIKDCRTPEFEGIFDEEQKLWRFQRVAWT